RTPYLRCPTLEPKLPPRGWSNLGAKRPAAELEEVPFILGSSRGPGVMFGANSRNRMGETNRSLGASLRRACAGLVPALLLSWGAAIAVALPGCRVSDSDVKRWEMTQHGPYKLVAVITHDKYPVELRTEAAMSLIRMPARGGVRQGIHFLVDKYRDEDGD